MSQTLLQKVQSDYNKIAKSFSDTRKYPWKDFELLFKNSQPITHSSKLKILDLACGNGRLYNFLNSQFAVHDSQNFKYIGVDNSTELLKQANIQYSKFKIKNLEFVFGDILRIPFPDNSFDQIWCIAAFHHLPKKFQGKGTKEIYRVLKKNGILVLTVWNLWQFKYLKQIVKAFFKNPLRIKNLFISWRRGETFVDRFYYAFTSNELKKTFTKSGFRIEKFFTSKNGQIVPWYKSFNLCLIGRK